jgi:hypothetical protein
MGARGARALRVRQWGSKGGSTACILRKVRPPAVTPEGVRSTFLFLL